MEEPVSDKEIDIRGLVCPHTFAKAKIVIESMRIGQVLQVLFDYEEASKSIPKSMESLGHKVLRNEKITDKDWLLRIRKERD